MKNMRIDLRGKRVASTQRQWWGMPAGFLAAMLALPATAGIDIPDDPLTTGARVPPNILFVLDDSGSMAFDAMPANSVSSNWTTRTYVHNAVYYNPAKTYLPWVGGDGNLLTGGTAYSAAYGSFNLVGGTTIDLGDSGSCQRYNHNQTPRDTDEFSTDGTQVCGGVQTFYVPRDTTLTDATYLSDQRNYYRYQILTDLTVEQAEWGAAISFSESPNWSPATNLSSSGAWLYYTVDIPAGATNFTISTAGGSGSDRQADLYVRHGLQPTSDTYNCRSRNNKSNNESCSVASPTPGIWHIGVRANTSFSGVTLQASYSTSNRCAGATGANTWINCTAVTPTGRSQAAERENYATWFSYHRTRMKAAKAGASAAFNELGSSVRVGFRTIWQQNGSNTTDNTPRQAVPIPVQYNDGLFDDVTIAGETYDNRSKWYSRLHGSIGQNGTPLHGALYQAGTYYQSSGTNGPYGPLTGSDQLACRQNFTIMTTDGYWNNETQNYPSAGRVGNADGADGPTISEPTTGATYTYEAIAPYADSNGDTNGTLADVAMRFWKNDLRTDMRNIVPTTSANPAFWQHMVTFGLSIGLSGNTGFKSVQDVPANYSAWPDPMPSENGSRIDDLLHAAVNSRGTFVAASDPDEFTEGLKSALAAIVERTGSFSNVAANSTAIDSETRVFQANYISGPWTGELRSQPITLEGGVEEVNCAGAGQPGNGWCASKGIPTVAERNIFTSNGHNDGNPLSPVVTSGTAGLVFPSQATASQLASLNRPGPSMFFPVTGAQNAAYIAGERSLELIQGGHLRNRMHLLGDIVGSSPAHVDDTDTIYVGANDGMLHAIDAANGNELFTFIPGIINWAHLGMLSRPDYAHRYFVDGSIVVTSRQQTPGENILVGALGKGGKGLFALDVTNPDSFGISDFKWERAETPEGNMGLVQGRPILGKVKDGTVTKNAVIVGNGMNSATDEAALIVLNLEDGSVIGEISTGAGSAALPNGLSSPTGVYGPDGRTLAYIYAGDMLGNVWKFDLSSTDTASWGVSKLFTATDIGGTAQPISGGVTIAMHPTTNKRWIFFGTGRYMTTGDVANTAVQGMYAFAEDDESLSRTDLTQRTVAASGTGPAPHFYPTRAFEASGALPVGSKGWFIDLPASGERIVQDPQVVSTFLITASMIPSGDACESDGSGFINALNAFTGASAGGSYFDLDGDGSTTDEYVGEIPVGSVNLGVGMPTLPNLLRGRLVAGGSSGSGLGSPLTLQPRWDRASWREIRGD